MSELKLPIGIQSFRDIRTEGYAYVDKTMHAKRLIDGGKHYFLSRPRRFGKSLFLDTLKALFEGNEPLFKGLAIHGAWDWSTKRPVIHLSFGGGHFTIPDGLHSSVMTQLRRQARANGLSLLDLPTAPYSLDELIHSLHESTGEQVVVLVDEYDKPILDALDKPEVARANRDYLRGLYAIIKDRDADIRFSFITGVSKFSKVSLFSGLNNLIDITLEPDYSTICGYTESDLDAVFASQLKGLDRAQVREWYNGYAWRGDEKVYNPFDILLLFRSREFKAHWFETGTPTFLIETLVRRGVCSFELDGMLASGEILSKFDVDDIAPAALLFQTGYLTIVGEERTAEGQSYRLGYPNLEVRLSLNRNIASYLAHDAAKREDHSRKLLALLRTNELAGMRERFQAFFASIPYEWYVKNDIARFEGFYASVFYSYFAGLELDLTTEDSTSQGRMDMALRFEERVYIFEFKVIEQAGEGAAMAQLRARGYADKFRADASAIYLVAVEFSSATRNIETFEWALA